EAAREHVHWLRAGFDAIAVGGTTALRDNPQLTVRGVITPRRPPVRVVFDRRAMLNLGVQLVSTAREVPAWVMSSLGALTSSVTQLENSGVRVFRPTTLRDGLRMLRDAGSQAHVCTPGTVAAPIPFADCKKRLEPSVPQNAKSVTERSRQSTLLQSRDGSTTCATLT